LSQPQFARRVNVGDGILRKHNGLCENPHDDYSRRNSQNDPLSIGLAPAGLRRFKCIFLFIPGSAQSDRHGFRTVANKSRAA
jgi:hypothetical protein